MTPPLQPRPPAYDAAPARQGRLQVDLLALGLSLFVFFFAGNLPLWLFTRGGPPPLWWYLAFLGFGLAMLFGRILARGKLFSGADWTQARAVFLWVFVWLAWTLVNFLASSQSEVAVQIMITRLEMAAVLAMMIWLIAALPDRRVLGLAFLAVTVLSAALNVFDFVSPTFSKVPGRAAGLHINPTISGYILTLAAVCAIPVTPRPLRWPLLALASAGVLLTFSRAAWLLLVLTVVLLVWSGALGFRRQRAAFGLAALIAFAALGFALVSGFLAEIVLSTPLADLLDPNTLARLGLAEAAADFSADERRGVLSHGWHAFAAGGQPFFGLGLGHTHEWDFRVSTHNMYLMYLVEGGIAGLAVFVALIAALIAASRGVGRILALNIAVYSLFSHNILDSPGRMIFVAVVACGVYGAPARRAAPERRLA